MKKNIKYYLTTLIFIIIIVISLVKFFNLNIHTVIQSEIINEKKLDINTPVSIKLVKFGKQPHSWYGLSMYYDALDSPISGSMVVIPMDSMGLSHFKVISIQNNEVIVHLYLSENDTNYYAKATGTIKENSQRWMLKYYQK